MNAPTRGPVLLLSLLLLLLGAGTAPAVAQDVDGPAPEGDAVPTESGPAQDRESPGYFFHRPDVDYGSASVWGPLGVVANRGFSNVVYSSRTRRLTDIPWRSGARAVWESYTDPGAAIARSGGWGEVLRREFLPYGWKVWEWAWAANYTGHIVAGGITYRQLGEWYRAHGAPFPRLLAATTSYASIVINEIVETPSGEGNGAIVTDLLFFDPLGMLLFEIDGVARFFSETLQAADWSPQASLTIPGGLLLNNAQIMAYKIPLPVVGERIRGLVMVGLGGTSGVAVDLDGRHDLGVSWGFYASNRNLDGPKLVERITAHAGGALTLDRDGSLLASLTYQNKGSRRVELNVYPGVLPGILGELGIWISNDQLYGPFAGIALRRTAGLGLGVDLAGG